MQDDGTHYLNVSSNIVFEVHEPTPQRGYQAAASAVSIGSVLQNNVFADSRLGGLLDVGYFIEPSADKTIAHNLFVNISSNCSWPVGYLLSQPGGPGPPGPRPPGPATLRDAGIWGACDNTSTAPSLCHLCQTCGIRCKTRVFLGLHPRLANPTSVLISDGFTNDTTPSLNDPVIRRWDHNVYHGVGSDLIS